MRVWFLRFLWCNMLFLVVGFSLRADYCWCLEFLLGVLVCWVLLFRVGVGCVVIAVRWFVGLIVVIGFWTVGV